VKLRPTNAGGSVSSPRCRC